MNLGFIRHMMCIIVTWPASRMKITYVVPPKALCTRCRKYLNRKLLSCLLKVTQYDVMSNRSMDALFYIYVRTKTIFNNDNLVTAHKFSNEFRLNKIEFIILLIYICKYHFFFFSYITAIVQYRQHRGTFLCWHLIHSIIEILIKTEDLLTFSVQLLIDVYSQRYSPQPREQRSLFMHW